MTSQSKLQKIPWYLLLIFGFLLVGILLIGYIYYQHQVAPIKQEKDNDLAAIIDLKIGQIVNWRWERLDDAKAHFVAVWTLFAFYPFSRLVHAPVTYGYRVWILFRRRCEESWG